MSQSKKHLKDLLKTFRRDDFTVKMENTFLSLIKEIPVSFFEDNFLVNDTHTQRQKDSRFTLNINLVRFLDKSDLALKAMEQITGKELLTRILLTTNASYIYSNIKFYLLDNNISCLEKKWGYSPLTRSLDNGLFIKNEVKTFGELVLPNIIGGYELDRIFESIYKNRDFKHLKKETRDFIEICRRNHINEIQPLDLRGVSTLFMGDWKNDVYKSQRSSIDFINMDSISFFINEFLPYASYNYKQPINTILPYLLSTVEHNKDYINKREKSVIQELLNVKIIVGNYEWLGNLIKDKHIMRINNDFCALNNEQSICNINGLINEGVEIKNFFTKEQLIGNADNQLNYINNLHKKDLNNSLGFLNYIGMNYEKESNNIHFNMLLGVIENYYKEQSMNNKEEINKVHDFCRNIDLYFYINLRNSKFWLDIRRKYDYNHDEIIIMLSAKEEKKALDNMLKGNPVYKQKIARI